MREKESEKEKARISRRESKQETLLMSCFFCRFDGDARCTRPRAVCVQVLPGWGFWGGSGAKTPKFIEKKQREDEAKREAAKQDALAARKDAALKHVIINEKRDKKVLWSVARDAIGSVSWIPFFDNHHVHVCLCVFVCMHVCMFSCVYLYV